MRDAFATIACITVITVTLKLADAIDWSWWWVTLPPLAALGIAALIFRK